MAVAGGGQAADPWLTLSGGGQVAELRLALSGGEQVAELRLALLLVLAAAGALSCGQGGMATSIRITAELAAGSPALDQFDLRLQPDGRGFHAPAYRVGDVGARCARTRQLFQLAS